MPKDQTEPRPGRRKRPKGAGAVVLRRELAACAPGHEGLPLVLDAVDLGDHFRVFLGNGTETGRILPDGIEGSALPLEIRPLSGSALVSARRHTSGSARLALADGSGLELSPTPAEHDLFRDLNTILAFRLEESAAQVAEGLAYHKRHHGLQAALIVNRLPETGAAFAEDLRAHLDDVPLKIVVLDVPVPLGKPGLGPENHLFLAPDAPGKDRMDPPAPDPWRSPLAEGIV